MFRICQDENAQKETLIFPFTFCSLFYRSKSYEFSKKAVNKFLALKKLKWLTKKRDFIGIHWNHVQYFSRIPVRTRGNAKNIRKTSICFLGILEHLRLTSIFALKLFSPAWFKFRKKPTMCHKTKPIDKFMQMVCFYVSKNKFANSP